jgi:midasin
LQALGEADKEEQVKPYDEDLEINDEEENLDAMDVEDNEDNFGEAEGNNVDAKADEDDVTDSKTDNQFFTKKQEDEDVIESYLAENIDYLDDLEQLIQTSDNSVKEDHPLRSLDESRKIWQKAEQSTTQLASMLSEQLRLILEPTLATKLKGDYKTGKRLNMKKIIPYIASQFRKDKIWLRRTKPSKREYQIMISVDNSKSMKLNPKTVDLTFDSIALVYKALQQLEAGSLSILKFGEYTKEILNFESSSNQVLGEEIVKEFNFLDNNTNVLNLVCESMKILLNAQNNKTEDTWQLHIIISDGILEDHELIQRLVRRCYEKKIMLVFLVLDIDSKESILDMQQVKYNSNNKLQITKYLDTFPFEFYLIINDINKLPTMLSEILRQYFQQQQ